MTRYALRWHNILTLVGRIAMACTPLQQPSGISYPLGTGRCSTVLEIRTANRIAGSVTSFDRSAFGSEPGICCERIEVVATR